MPTSTDRYLDAVKIRLNIPSDNQLAKHWNVTRQRITEYRRGVTSFSDERCIEVARILGIPAEQVLFEIQAERARKAGKTSISDLLEDVLRRLKSTPATLLAVLFSTGLLFASNDPASMNSYPVEIPYIHIHDFAIIGIMSNCLVWIIRHLATTGTLFPRYVKRRFGQVFCDAL